jgi:hypothetical protein
MQELRQALLCGNEALSATTKRRVSDAVTPVPIPTHSTSMIYQREIKELISELRMHFDRLREKAAWLGLQRNELRPDDFISHSMFMDAANALRLEHSLLAGHAFMVQQEFARRHSTPDAKTKHLLRAILNYTRGT